MSNDDPFAQYGGAADDPALDPFAKYGGAEIKSQLQPAARPAPIQSPASAPSDASLYWRALTNPVGEGLKSATSPLGAFEQIGGQAIKGAAAIPNMLLHPLDTMHQISPWVENESIGQKLQPAVDAVKGLFTGNPLPAENLAGQTIGAVEGGRATAAGAGKIVRALPAIPGVPAFSKPISSTAIVSPEEQAARGVANAVNVSPNRAQDYIKAAQVELPNVLDYAKRTSNPLNTQLEFSKAAEGNALESRAHYENNVLGPNENHQVKAPPGYGGSALQSGENPANKVTSLRNLDDRIVQINKDLDIHKANPGDVRPGLASKADLTAEKGQLTDLLHRSLSDLTGIPKGDIADLRARVGRSWELAHDTNTAVTGRGLVENAPGGQTGGLQIPHGIGDLAQKAVNFVRGGPTAIGDRAFQKAIKNFPGKATPLPQPTGPIAMPSAPTGRPPTQPPTQQPYVAPQPNPSDLAAQQQTRANNVQQYQNAQARAAKAAEEAEKAAGRNRAAAKQEVIHGTELDQAAQDASAARAQQATEGRLANRAADAQRYVGAETHDFDMAAWKKDHPGAPEAQLNAVRSRLQKSGFTVRE